MRHLDISNLRSSQRIVTQTIALDLWTQGKPGIVYKSNLDSGLCLALFEGTPTLNAYGRPRKILADDPLGREMAGMVAVVERSWKQESRKFVLGLLQSANDQRGGCSSAPSANPTVLGLVWRGWR